MFPVYTFPVYTFPVYTLRYPYTFTYAARRIRDVSCSQHMAYGTCRIRYISCFRRRVSRRFDPSPFYAFATLAFVAYRRTQGLWRLLFLFGADLFLIWDLKNEVVAFPGPDPKKMRSWPSAGRPAKKKRGRHFSGWDSQKKEVGTLGPRGRPEAQKRYRH